MSYKLYLDDLRVAPSECVTVRSFEEFTAKIEADGLPYWLSFDHDLGLDKDGFDCLMWLTDYVVSNDCWEPIAFNVHSVNPVGRLRLQAGIAAYKALPSKMLSEAR